MLKNVNFVKYTAVIMNKPNKKGNKTFTAMFLLWIRKPKMAQVYLSRRSILFLNVPTLKRGIIIITLPTAPK